jgi:glycine/D-amino acid oxidase-like deaminating enzyme
MQSKNTPVPNGMTSFWRTEPHTLDSHRSTEFLPNKCDIAIIGAGYAGASVTHHILSQISPGSKPPSIVILEARQACSGATGRNGKIKISVWSLALLKVNYSHRWPSEARYL